MLLIQPRHVYAPPFGQGYGQIYIPTSLLSVASRLVQKGIDVQIVDENIEVVPSFANHEFVGINMIGAPYVEPILDLIRRIPGDLRIAVGGQGISGFRPREIVELFGNVINGNAITQLQAALGTDELLTPETTSLVRGLELLSEKHLRMYLKHELSLYTSQGCQFSCTFCAAQRSHSRGAAKSEKEVYREMHCTEADLQYIMRRAVAFGIPNLTFYLTNLDLFQSPHELSQFADMVAAVKSDIPGVNVEFRGLATVSSFMKAHLKHSSIIVKLVECGLRRVGFGIDGGVPQIWRATRKPHRTLNSCIAAIQAARCEYNLTPETLMVFGHNGYDTPESLAVAADFAQAMYDEYGAFPRPHIAKDLVPGNDGWYNLANHARIKYLLQNPRSFQWLDFTALPSRFTHPDDEFRQHVTAAIKRVCSIDACRTKYVLPFEDRSAEIFNQGRYDI